MPEDSANSALIDSNVLVYAYHPGDARHENARLLLDRLIREGTGRISIQNLVEFCHVVRHKARVPVQGERLGRFVRNLRSAFPVLPYSGQTIQQALSLADERQVHFFDALLAATMLENGIGTIYTEDVDDFAHVPGITAKNPFEKS